VIGDLCYAFPLVVFLLVRGGARRGRSAAGASNLESRDGGAVEREAPRGLASRTSSKVSR
jgi:hypothetical protein